MNVIISNKYQSLLASLNIDVIKSINGEFSVDELKSKLDTILLSYAKSGKLNFAVEDGDVHDDNAGKKTVSKKTFGNPSQTKKKNRYGSLFA